MSVRQYRAKLCIGDHDASYRVVGGAGQFEGGARWCKYLHMDSIVMLCTDGSELATAAMKESLPLLAPADRTIVVAVSTPVDAEFTTGTGFATGPNLPELDEQHMTSGDLAALAVLGDVVAELDLEQVEMMSIVGEPGQAICDLAASLPASVVVIGTHGRSGFRRRLMGSTSDYVVRNAVCPVLVQGAG